MDKDLIQVFFVQDEEIGKAMSDHIGCAPVDSTDCKQTENVKRLWSKIYSF